MNNINNTKDKPIYLEESKGNIIRDNNIEKDFTIFYFFLVAFFLIYIIIIIFLKRKKIKS